MSSSAAETVLTLHLREGVCVTAHLPAASRGALVCLAPQQLQVSDLRTALASLSQQLGAPWPSAALKLVGPTALTATVKAFIESAGGRIAAVAECHGDSVDIVFYPASGRLRLARQPGGFAPSATPWPSAALAGAKKRRHRLLIVDDSPTIQRLLSQMFTKEADFEVVAVTGQPTEVEALITQHRPDVMTLDIHMPGMDGVAVLRQIMPRTPLPTVMITSLNIEEGGKVLDALEAGAVDYVQKPSLATLSQQSLQIVEKVRNATQAQVLAPPQRPAVKVASIALKSNLVVVIGSSTGGTEALKDVLTRLPAEIPPILIVQHIPPVFSAALAARLDGLCPFSVKEAKHGDEVLPNRVLIAPGGQHMRLAQSGDRRWVELDETPPHNRHRPSVDLLFASAAELMPKQTIGILLTGMGADGAQGLLALRSGGARTMAQDEKSCVVYGMPKEAVKLGAAEQVLDLYAIPAALMKLAAR